MASLVLGAAGAVVGSFFGPLGASIGWALGSALGNALDPVHSEGPRLTDLKIQNSSYGQMIPIFFGTVRISGNVIWSTDLVEHSQKSGGKGGPTVTTYTYTASWAVQLSEGPIGGVKRIWADSRLVWDPTTMVSADFPFTLYFGDETQGADPTMEAEEGVGNVPGYRGTAYIVFSDFLLTDFGNRLPSLTFEVFSTGGPIPWQYSEFRPINDQSQAGPNGLGPQSGMLVNGQLVMGRYTENPLAGPTYEEWTYDLQGNLIDTATPVSCPQMAKLDSDPAGTTVLPCSNNPFISWGRISAQGFLSCAGFYYRGALVQTQLHYYQSNAYCVYSNDAVFTVGDPSGGSGTPAAVLKWPAPGGVPNSAITLAGYSLPNSGTSSSAYVLAVDDVGNIWVSNTHSAGGDPRLFKLDDDLNLLHSWDVADLPAGFENGSLSFTVWSNILFFPINPTAEGKAYYINADYTFTLADPGSILDTFNPVGGFLFGNSISLGNGLVLTHNGIVSLQAQPSAITLGSIVSALSVRADLTTDQIDVTELGDLVDGYVIGNQSNVRSLIEPLQAAWPFDGVEHDVVVKFVRRGYEGLGATIPLDDLGAFIAPGDPPERLKTQRIQEVDLPRIVDAVFINKDTDYQNGEQRAQRLITTSDLTTSLQLPIVMTNEKAKEVTEVLLYDAWTERERFTITLPRKWLHLEPADVIIAASRMIRVTQKNDGAGGVITVQGAATSLAVYLQATTAPAGVGMPGSGGVPPTPGPVLQDTDLRLLDLPLIRDTDNAVGFYAAMAGALQPSWPGATLFKSIDGGMSFNPELVNTVSDTFGTCSTTLGDFSGGNIFDELNSVTVVVSLGSGTLSSVSRLAVLNGANMAAIGTIGTTGIRNIEIIQFRDATLVGTRTYTLTGLLRGRRGTEWMIGSHVASESFVLLPTSTNVVGDPAELYLARQYRAVTSGRPLSSAAVLTFTNYGIAVLPYAPVSLGGGRFPNDDLLLQWHRRTRIGGGWKDFIDVPLSEAIEEYQIRIYSDGTYATPVRVTTSTVEAFLYQAGMQTTDFGSVQSIVYWGVSQLGTFNFGTEARGAT